MRLLLAILSMMTNLFVNQISGAAYIKAIIICFPVGQPLEDSRGGGTVLVLFSLLGRGVLSFGNNRTTGTYPRDLFGSEVVNGISP